MNPLTKDVLAQLAVDPLAMAEQVTGRSYKTDKVTEAIGVAMYFNHANDKQDLLTLIGDSTFCMDANKWKTFVVSLGFQIVLDTFHGSRNAADCYFQMRNAKGHMPGMSGGVENAGGEMLYVGSFDAREALRSKLEMVRANGELLHCWKVPSFLWLLHHADSEKEGYDYKAINRARLAMLPKEIQDCIPIQQ